MAALLAIAARRVFAQSANAQGVAPIGEIFRCQDRGITWCYNFSVVKEADRYRAYFFAPATKRYAPKALECVYMARTTTAAPPSQWTANSWSGFTGREIISQV